MLHYMLNKLGGEAVRDDGRQILVPAENHSKHDRSLSISIGRTGKVIVHQHNGGDWQSAMAYLRRLHLVQDDGSPLGSYAPAPSVPMPCDAQKTEIASRIWAAGVPIAGTLSQIYLRRFRKIQRDVSTIGAVRHGLVPLSPYNPAIKRALPAFISRIDDAAGQLTSVEIVYLNAHGDKDLSLKLPRKSIGPIPRGSVIALDAEAETIGVGEGVPTALSVGDHFGLPVRALRGNNMRFWRPGPKVRHVLIGADNGKGGVAYSSELKYHLDRLGVSCEIKFPPAGYDDWNTFKRKAFQ